MDPRPAPGWTTAPLLLALSLTLIVMLSTPATVLADDEAESGTITALGRLEPRGGVIRVAGPSNAAVVISELAVEEGDLLEKGQLIARLDSHARNRALVSGREAELADSERELLRSSKLEAGRAASISARETNEMRVKVAKANLAAAQAELALSEVRAPIDGQVLAVHARAGERVGPEGIVELGRTSEMYAIAEVYETDIGRVREGQRATVTSEALGTKLEGSVEQIGLMVAKMDVLGTDPVAKTDARVIEVKIRLDEGQDVAKLTYLQVTVEITPSS